MLEAAVEAAAGMVEILGVSVLTHLGAADLEELDMPGSATERAVRWGRLAAEAGCAGVVPRRARSPRCGQRLPPSQQLVTPGIRPASVAGDDQRRVATPAEALAAGADYLVVGRPLTQADDPAAALEALREELATGASF